MRGLRTSVDTLLFVSVMLASVVVGGAAAVAVDVAGVDGRELQRSVERVRIELTVLGEPAEVRAYLDALGARIELESGGRVQALVPAARIDELRSSALLRVEAPARFVPLQVSTASSIIGVTRWGSAGFTGRGTRVAIIDTGFDGYESALPSLPGAAVTARSFRADGRLAAGTDHGTRAAEIVRELAPGAELLLLNFATVTELSAAVDYAIEMETDIISFSVGFVHNGPGDGTGAVNALVGRASEAGVLWVVAAGNWAEQHWTGTFTDVDGDSLHEFEPGSETNGREYQAGDLITVSLRWDDVWGAACSDYDIELFGPSGALVRASRGVQSCDADPVEGLQVLATQTGRYSVRVVQADAAEPRTLDLLMLSSPDRGGVLEISVAAHSLAEPADHPAALAVGAVDLGGAQPLATSLFSSRGPTADGRTKPDLVSPTGQAPEGAPTAFSGTSAAAPHVAGAAALLKEARPGLAGAELAAELLARSLDLDGGTSTDPSERRLLQLGSLFGLGVLLPIGAEEAAFAGIVPTGGGLGILRYQGPDGFPVRFAHLLTGGVEAVGFFRFDTSTLTWQRHILGAPNFVNTFSVFRDGDLLVARFKPVPQP